MTDDVVVSLFQKIGSMLQTFQFHVAHTKKLLSITFCFFTSSINIYLVCYETLVSYFVEAILKFYLLFFNLKRSTKYSAILLMEF